MARTVSRIELKPSATNKRPAPIPLTLPDFCADIGRIVAIQLDETSVILVPDEYTHDFDDSVDARWRDEQGAGQCWKTTMIYEQINETHPHLVP